MFDDLNIFVKVAEVANYSKAATLLNTSQATITRRIQSLELELGLSLVKRNSRTFELTEQGKVVYANTVAAVKDFATALTDFKENKETIKGTLKVAIPAALSYELINPLLSQFNFLYPQVKLIITYTSNPIDLMKDDYNLAISTILPTSQTSKVKLLKKFHFKLYASPLYLAQHAAPQEPKDLEKHNILGLMGLDGSLRMSYPAINIATGKETVVNYQASIYINNLLHGIQLAKSGNFIIGGWDELMTTELANGSLVPILQDYLFGEMSCYFIRHNNTPSKLENLFAEFIFNNIRS
jgi:DNA-binding transcriptional LysR family regulator